MMDGSRPGKGTNPRIPRQHAVEKLLRLMPATAVSAGDGVLLATGAGATGAGAAVAAAPLVLLAAGAGAATTAGALAPPAAAATKAACCAAPAAPRPTDLPVSPKLTSGVPTDLVAAFSFFVSTPRNCLVNVRFAVARTVVSAVGGVRTYAADHQPIRLRLIAVLTLALVAFSGQGFLVDISQVLRVVATDDKILPASRLPIELQGFKESTRPVILGLGITRQGLILVAVGVYRSGRQELRSARA